MPGKLVDKVALITGGGSGIGRATSQLLAAEGAAVVVADVAADGGGETVRSIQADGGRALFVRTDVTDSHQVDQMVAEAVKAFGGLHILFANAGVGGYEGPLTACTDVMWQKVIDVNLTGVFYCCRAAIPAIQRSGGGSIVITSSVAGITAMPHNHAYNVTKAGVILLAYGLAPEVGPEIRVNVVAPGVIATPMNDFYNVPYDRYAELTPLARVGRAEDVAEAVLDLVSDGASFITRTVLTVDGGSQARRPLAGEE